jgi:hypothetical protein
MPKGRFKSERQRRFMWANAKAAAHKWAHGRKTKRADWRGARAGATKVRRRRRSR